MQTSEFELNFYKNKIAFLEQKKKLSTNDIVTCQQMLQIIDNNKNYYPKQHKAMLLINAYQRLETILKKYGAKKLGEFVEPTHQTPQFENTEIELEEFIKSAKNNTKITKNCKKEENFLQDLKNYTNWILKNNTKNTSYVFLLRDMFLCYLRAEKISRNSNIYPLLFGRKMLKFFYNDKMFDNFDFDFSDDEELYMQFLQIIFDAATKFNDNFDKFFKYLKPKFLKIIKANKPFYLFLKSWLVQIKTPKIVVVESGRYATIPLILMCIDSRVEFRLFSTSPEFYDLYGKRIFVKNLDKMIALEKSISQNEMFIFSSVLNGKIMVKQNTDKKVLQKCFKEIAQSRQ